MRTVDVVIPTFNQPHHLAITLSSLMRWTRSSYKVYVVDNSVDKYAKGVCNSIDTSITVLEPDSVNLGWMGGVNFGAAHGTGDFILMLNDDIRILDFDHLWLQRMLETMEQFSEVGVVVPSSNYVMGFQSIECNPDALNNIVAAVSGFCLLTRRNLFESLGGLDDTLPGGDDLDYSIRVRDAGYQLSVRKDVFVYHYGSKTGRAAHGNYWDSLEYTDRLNKTLIHKHGLRKFLVATSFMVPPEELPPLEKQVDWEREMMVPHLVGVGLDVGCGNRKVIPSAIGVDRTPKGEQGKAGSQLGRESDADVAVDGNILPFDNNSMDYVHTRHVIEHIVDTMEALSEWVRVLKNGGKLVIAAPDETVVEGILLDPSHKHAITLDSLKRQLSYITDFRVVDEGRRDISFVLIVEVLK